MKRLAVLGHPVSHSRSPAMQNAALEALGLGGEWSYEALDIEPAEFAERTKRLPEQDFVGVNVTIPHKRAALALADDASEAAEQIGAANTLTFVEGAIHAENTDAGGLLSALPDPPAGRRALVLGAGGGLGDRGPGGIGLGLEPHGGACGGARPRPGRADGGWPDLLG